MSLKTISPVDGRVYVERDFADGGQIAAALDRARAAQAAWRRVPVADRAAFCTRAVDAFVAEKEAIAAEISWQMGRPVRYAPGEVGGFEERARHMIAIAGDALAPLDAGPKAGFTRYVRREPLGVVFTVAPWNYPYLTAVNSIVPAIMAGNAVILKHSAQTPLCAERIHDAFAAAGLPGGVFQFLHLSHDDTEKVIADDAVDFVAFTGSVPGGAMVERAAAGRFKGVGLELGGKDPAYVRADADLDHAVENVVDGAFFNSGQSCCGIERVYVHADVYDAFVAGAAELVRGYVLGDPLDPATTLGPLVRTAAADLVRGQTAAAVAAGARALVDPAGFPAARDGTPYLAPQVLVDVDHAMAVMTEESFGPVVGIMKVADDDQAVRLMNDSAFGLTASVWTRDADAAVAIGDAVQTGTWFMNRCDYLDPALAWTGVKQSGRGCTLSRVGYEHLTRPKSYHLRTAL
ncbi:MAG: aldehyde dehydrogenase family protein [Hyphomicrobiales bacterium]|nr:aldehyde dehydrogenase family protein [Hyphomicrobiales bacterium]MCP5374011.1 aldehyde dehydrogenase family protein [Hyphomicrobiales bacterium]